MDTCSEALAQLDDVIMHTFQQCVYHLTKVKNTNTVFLPSLSSFLIYLFSFYSTATTNHCLSFLSAKTLYSLLPALLDTNPFSSEEKEKEKDGAEGGEREGGAGEVDDVSALPPKVAGLVEVYRCSLMLSREACLSPPLTSQTFGYLFFFTNTSLLNTLLERGKRSRRLRVTVPQARPEGLGCNKTLKVICYSISNRIPNLDSQIFFSLFLFSPLSTIFFSFFP